MLEVKYHDGLARLGILYTRHGKVKLPVFCPVINPNKLLVKPEEILKKFKAELIMTNSYIIYKNKELREVAREKGVHSLLNFPNSIIVDNGGYQIHIYRDVKISPLEILRFQEEIRPDIGIVLDYPTSSKMSREEAAKTVEITLKNARDGVNEIREKSIIWSAPIQGGSYFDLIRKCSRELRNLPYSMHSLGEPVQFLNNYEFRTVVEMIYNAKSNLPINRVFHIFGAGLPSFMPLAALLGCDVFDSASYAIFARDDRYMTEFGTFKLEEIGEEFPCECEVCSKYSVSEMKEMLKWERERLLALHNLYVLFKTIKEIRLAIRENRLFELCAIRCRSHPKLLGAFIFSLRKFRKLFEKYDPFRKRSGLFYTGRETFLRPEVIRAKRRVMEIFGKKKVPRGLDQTYPFFQSLSMEGKSIFEFEERKKISDLERIRIIADYQFGKGIGKVLFPRNVKIVKSPRTKRIRQIFLKEKLIATFRCDDGMLCLRIEGAKRILKILKGNRVFLKRDPEIEEIVKKGKDVFVKFVKKADFIIPREEVIVLSSDSKLLGVGEAILSSDEMNSLIRGVAVKIREGIHSSNTMEA